MKKKSKFEDFQQFFKNIFFLFIFQLETIDGEILQVQRDDSGLKIQSDTSEVNIKLGDIETEFGLIHIIDSVLIWN